MSCVALQASLHLVAAQCQRRLDYITKSGAKRGVKLPTIDEITQSLVSLKWSSTLSATLLCSSAVQNSVRAGNSDVILIQRAEPYAAYVHRGL